MKESATKAWFRMGGAGCLVALVMMSAAMATPAREKTAADTSKVPPYQGEAKAPAQPLTLWYRRPARQWMQALPLGNGRLGAMVFGDPLHERIALNDDTLWSGHPQHGTPEGAKWMPALRQAVFAGDYAQADVLARKMEGPWSAVYLPLGNLRITFHGRTGAIRDYRRSLDLTRAVAAAQCRIKEVGYKEQVFVSYPDHVMVVRLSADQTGRLTFDASLDTQLHFASHVDAGRDTIVMTGKAPIQGGARHGHYADSVAGEGMNFEVRLKAVMDGGSVTTADGELHIKGANRVTLLLASGTSFNGYNHSPGLDGLDPSIKPKHDIAAASRLGYEKLLQRHLADYQPKFARVSLDLPATGQANEPTDERIKDLAKVDDPAFAALAFQFGRYLMLAGSRPGTQPLNLQGIWNEYAMPPWRSNYTVNINIEMNYWPAEEMNLAAEQQPLFALLEHLADRGRRTARVDYGAGGWCCHHNTDIWAMTWPVGGGKGSPVYATWPMGGVWLSHQLWEHYAFGCDKQFLRQTAWPIMKGAAQFCLGILVPNKQSQLVTIPSTSPEQAFHLPGSHDRYGVSMATAMDMTLIRQLFTECMKASQVLGEDQAFAAKLRKTYAKLYPIEIAPTGGIQEFYKPSLVPADPHRLHMSHVVGLYPLSVISPKTPRLYAAAKKAVDLRGGGYTGWSIAWRMAIRARLGQGEQAYKYVRRFCRSYLAANLFDMFMPGRTFQIDANFGYTAAVAQMLLQSEYGYIEFIPALPEAWSSGSFTGLRARNGFTVDLHWRDGKPRRATVMSNAGRACKVRSPTPIVVYHEGKSVAMQVRGDIYSFSTKAGQSYRIDWPGNLRGVGSGTEVAH